MFFSTNQELSKIIKQITPLVQHKPILAYIIPNLQALLLYLKYFYLKITLMKLLIGSIKTKTKYKLVTKNGPKGISLFLLVNAE